MTNIKSGKNRSAVIGAAFLMATSAIGPGFITQTTKYTAALLTSFGFVILISLLLDIAAQMNIWRILAVANAKAQDVANRVLPGMGYILSVMIVVGGLVFNIGNVGGAGLGLNVSFGINTITGAFISAGIALFIFWVKEAGFAMDWFARILGFVMIALTLYVAVSSEPPLARAALHSIIPQKIDPIAIITIVGGTIGGYISFAGAHRLLDAGISGEKSLPEVTRSSIWAIVLATTMRILLFLAALGVISHGAMLDPNNPAASVFRFAAGEAGYRIFGLVLWSAAITSIVGSAYTSVSFLRTLSPFFDRHNRMVTTVFIAFSTIVFSFVNNPVSLLVFAGTINGFILPAALAMMLLAARKKEIVGAYRHPRWMSYAGWFVVIIMTYMVSRFFYN